MRTAQMEETNTLLPEEWSPHAITSRDSRRRKKGAQNLVTEQSFSEELGHAAAETYLITTLTFTLLRYLGLGYRWLTRFTALGLYAMFLMPGFLQVSYYYFFSSQVRRSVIYGDKPRNRMDLYIPTNINEPKPVVAFITGGAWIIGYKAWGALLGMQLVERDIIVACIDYRNFPQGTISDMVEDASNGINFIINNIAEYGGDPNRIYLMGQSAGAHIASCALVEQAVKGRTDPESVRWNVSMLRYFFGLSGGYNLCKLVDHFHSRGLYRSLLLSVMEGEESLRKFSPEIRIQEPENNGVAQMLPRVVLFHGTEDSSIPSESSKTFAESIVIMGGEAQYVSFDGKTHTDLFLQDPLRGGKDEMVEHLVSVIHAGDRDALARDAAALPRRRLVPEVLLRFARKISPF